MGGYRSATDLASGWDSRVTMHQPDGDRDGREEFKEALHGLREVVSECGLEWGQVAEPAGSRQEIASCLLSMTVVS